MATNHFSSNFQRTQSKVWWSDFDNSVHERKIITNFSSWTRQGSPSSHKSQDSGFDDSELSSPPLPQKIIQIPEDTNLNDVTTETSPGMLTPKKPGHEETNHQLTPSSSVEATPVTPPTVIRRHNYPANRDNRSSRRISFSAPTSPNQTSERYEDEEDDDERFRYDFAGQIDNLNYSNTSPLNSNSSQELNQVVPSDRIKDDLTMAPQLLNCNKCDRDRSIKRGRTISRSSKFNRSLIGLVSPSKFEENYSPKKSILKKSMSMNTDEDRNNNSTIRSLEEEEEDHEQPMRTSTPKPERRIITNGPPPCVQAWMKELRFSYQHEVMSTLQTKSIAIEAGRNLKVTAAIAAKLIRSTQSNVMTIQGDFEKLERMLAADSDCDIDKIATFMHVFMTTLIEFVEKQKTRITIYAENDADLKRFADNINNVIEMAADLKMAAIKLEDEFDVEIIREDLIVLKRYVLITVRLIFEKLVTIIIHSIEQTGCELILRSNLSTLSMLSNIDYAGFASLNAAFLANETVRVLLLQILESKQSSIRALALRALATVCSTQEAIRQFEQAGGVEILKEVMVDHQDLRCEPELRETVSVLTQLTAPWHGDTHRIQGLKICIEGFVEAITELLSTTTCCQTLLLCAACLNNFSRMEPTSIYSFMSHDTVSKIQIATDNRGPGASIFLYVS